MIPIRLEIQGLYSYKEKQIIEFEHLTAAGLFGIFGSVGSGKSSILEAILLALYGSTERLAATGERSSMVNLQSDVLTVSFEFLSGGNNANTYLARYSAKRNKKDPEKIDTGEHTFKQLAEEEWIPLAVGAEKIIGMKKEHFKQTVIIPQGKFREFIDLTPGPRAEMMKELFGLGRFDLSSKTISLLKTVREEKIRLETQLQGLEAYSEAALKEQEELQQLLNAKLSATKLDAAKKEEEYKNTEACQEKHFQLKEFQKEWTVLEQRKPEIEEKKNKFKDFLKAKTYLKPVFERLHETRLEIEKFEVSVTDCSRFKEQHVLEVAKMEEEELALKQRVNERPQREAKIRDLKKVIDLQQLQKDCEGAQSHVNALRPDIDTHKEKLKATQAKIHASETQIDTIELVTSSELAELKSAAKEWEQFETQLEKLSKELATLQDANAELEEKKRNLLKNLPADQSDFQSWSAAIKAQLEELDKQKQLQFQKQGLAAHSHLLEDGKPCPLCGASEHPHPILAAAQSSEIEALDKRIKAQKLLIDDIATWSNQLRENTIRLEHVVQERKAKTQEKETVGLHLQNLMEQMEVQQIQSRSTLLEYIQKSDQEASKKEELETTIKKLRAELETIRDQIEKGEANLSHYEQKLIQHQSASDTKKKEIHDQDFCDKYLKKSPEEIRNAIEIVQENIEQTILLLDSKQKALRELRDKQTTNLSELNTNQKRLAEAKDLKERLEGDYARLKAQYDFDDDQALQKLFNSSLDEDKVELEIKKFENRQLVVQSKIEELQKAPGVNEFDEALCLELKEQLKAVKEELENRTKELTLLNNELQEGKAKLAKKKELQATYSKLEDRESNLKELERLFKGSGFVKYVSTIYLKELCNTANLRFMKLSKNSLSLEIDDNNTFWVLDYLNGGKRRLLKTLSGGQTFQASLCLALALAEKVKSLNQADQSFFFLDEGFGALDKSSLRVVFETLKALRHENRIVGIISHVEELQQEIGVFAKVTLDSEVGSQVSYSFEG